MRVLNDNQTPKEREKTPLDFMTVLIHTVYAALSFGCAGSAFTVFLVPLPMIANHLRLDEPWPKITAIFGAVVALLFFGMPPEVVSLIFVLGLVVGEGVKTRQTFWKLALRALAICVFVLFAATAWNAQLRGLNVPQYWNSLVERLLSGYAEMEVLKDMVNPKLLHDTLLYEGPFLLLAGILLCIWISVGFAAHLGWFPEKHPLHATQLRKLRLPVWVPVVFAVLFAARFVPEAPLKFYLEGMFMAWSSVILVQGCVYLSALLVRKRLGRGLKLFIYAFSLTFGSYALVALGVFGNWFLNKTNTRRSLEVAHESHS
ncbi:MAG: DUF2232 domain-containing protein [Bdellovibrionota bacterium]